MGKRLLGSALVAVGIIAGLTTTAAADPPPGSADTCPAMYQPMTHEQLMEQARRNGFPEDRASAMWHRVNKNGDAWICQRQMSGELHYNWIDNQAVGTEHQP